MKFLEKFTYVIKYKKGKFNIVVDALLRRHTLFSKLELKFLDLITYLNFMTKTLVFPPLFLVVNIGYKEIPIF